MTEPPSGETQPTATTGRHQPPPAPHPVTGWMALGIPLVVLLAYIPSLSGGFVLTDEVVLLRNPLMQADGGLHDIWLSARSDQYQPLVYTSFWIEHRLWGDWATGYRLVNVLLHAANALLVWRLLRRVGVPAAAVAALLFGLHPVNVESVAWIYERKNVLSGLFYLLTFAALLRFDDGGRWTWYAVALPLFVAALLSKASTVVLPAILLLYWWWRGEPLGRRRVLAVVPVLLLAAGMAVLTVWYEQQHTGAKGAVYAVGALERFARAGWIATFFLSKALLPVRLMFFYPQIEVDPAAWQSYLPHAGLLAAILIGVVKRRSWGRPLLFGLGAYLIALFPMLGFFDIYYHRFSLVADHFQYLALIGLIALIVGAVAHGLSKFAGWKGPDALGGLNTRARELALLAVLLAAFLTWQRARVFRDTESVCLDTLRHDHDCWIAHFKLGEHLLVSIQAARQKPTRESVEQLVHHLQEARRLRPNDIKTLQNLGTVMSLLGEHDQAVTYLRRAIDLDPDNRALHTNLGVSLEAQGRMADAIVAYRRAVECDPESARAHLELGRALVRDNHVEEGLAHLREAVRLDPGNRRAAEMLDRVVRRVPKAGGPPANGPGSDPTR